MYSPQLIQWYIDRALEALKENRWSMQDRHKNIQTLIHLNLTIKDVFNCLLSLKVSDYFEGPSPDRDRPGTSDFWIFKIKVHVKDIYVKMKIEPLDEDKEKVNVVSFHIDEIK